MPQIVTRPQESQQATSIPEALLAYQKIQNINNSGQITPEKQVSLALEQRKIQLLAEDFEFQKRKQSFDQYVKLMEQGTELQKTMAMQELDKEIRDAYASGNNALARQLEAQRTGGQTKQTFQDRVGEAEAQGFLSKDQSATAVQRELLDPTTNEQNIQVLDTLVNQGIITDEERKSLIIDMFDDNVRAKTDTADSIDILNKFPPGDPTASGLNKLNLSLPKSNAERFFAYIGRLTETKPFDQLTDVQKSQAANEFKTAAELKVGNDSVKKVMQARELLQSEIPYLLNLMEQYEVKHGEGSLGRKLQIANGVVKFVTGAPRSPELDAIFTTTQDMVANVLLIRSGATVTDEERNIMNAMVPNAVVPLRFSRARGLEILRANKRAAQRYYSGAINKAYADVIVADYYTADIKRIQQAQINDPEMTPAPAGWTESMIEDMMQSTVKTRKEVVDYIKSRENQ